jgi:predicted secreted hydrolase
MKGIKALGIVFGIIFIVSSCKNPFLIKYNVKGEIVEFPKSEAFNNKNSLEWWYLTGVLRDSLNNRYGVEYVFFHFCTKDHVSRVMVNVAITDENDSVFYYDYLIKRQKNYLGEPIASKDFKRHINENGNREGEIGSKLPINFQIKDYSWTGGQGYYNISAKMEKNSVGFNLTTTPTKSVVLHGDSGYLNYGDITTAGYYSYPRLKTKGSITLNDKVIPVEGIMWYDRQWNCGEIKMKDINWDWTGISLDNKSDLMIYRIQSNKNENDLFGGTYIDSLGNTMKLNHDDIKLVANNEWKSPNTNESYPLHWEIEIPKLEIKLTIIPIIPNQELTIKTLFGGLSYWEGLCDVEGEMNGKPVKGESYLEMTNK